MADSYRFNLPSSFIDSYRNKPVPWGYGALSYLTYKRTYARRLDEDNPLLGTEEWWQTCKRVVEGMFTIQKQHVLGNHLPWYESKAQRTAKEAYDRLFHFKWTPPGRGLWMMGTKFVDERTAAGLYNCAFASTKDLAVQGGSIFEWIMDALMLGIGVGFDTLGAGAVVIKQPGLNKSVSHPKLKYCSVAIHSKDYRCLYISDDREGWAESVKLLLDSYFFGQPEVEFDYSQIREAGAPIKGFGGTSSGAQPLIDLHKALRGLLDERIGKPIRSTDIVDIENLIGVCVVAGNVRRSAALALGNHNDFDFLTMKNDKEKRESHRWGSNNSCRAYEGMDYTWHAGQSQLNGEPGYIWLDNARTRGRMQDLPRYDDMDVMGFNPCVEQQLADRELCCLTETFPNHHDSYEDYKLTLKIAYLYAKTVTLTRTHWPQTNAVMWRKRRIGLSASGIQQACNRLGRRKLLGWFDQGYEYVQELDQVYSDWLCIPRSVRTTSVKPSGTVSLLAGATPGVHFPEDQYYIRRVRFASNDPLLGQIEAAGYPVELSKTEPRTVLGVFPVKEHDFVRGKREVSMWEQLEVAAQMQYYWADNSVSVTVTFKDDEADQIKDALEYYESRLKAVSFLRYEETGYEQAPYEPITEEEYHRLMAGITPLEQLQTIDEGVGEKFCDGDSCQLPLVEAQL